MEEVAYESNINQAVASKKKAVGGIHYQRPAGAVPFSGRDDEIVQTGNRNKGYYRPWVSGKHDCSDWNHPGCLHDSIYYPTDGYIRSDSIDRLSRWSGCDKRAGWNPPVYAYTFPGLCRFFSVGWALFARISLTSACSVAKLTTGH